MSYTFDKTWDKIYRNKEQLNIYPYSDFVSFYIKNFSKKKNINFLEIGCGFGNNLIVPSSLNHNVYGIDASKNVIELVKNRFMSNNKIKIFKQDFTNLKFKNNTFDFILNRESLTTTNYKNAKKAINQCYKKLKKNGLFYSTFVTNLNQFNGIKINDMHEKLKGNFQNVNKLRFYNIFEIKNIFEENFFKLEKVYLNQQIDYLDSPINTTSHWVVIAKK
tara:strand:- start:748 stop:1404 length:657 start_codon:yes stop_codon:yes gene_type:complete